MSIRALPFIGDVCRSANWPVPSTIEGTTDLKIQKVLQAVNYVGQMLGRYYYWRWLLKETHLRTIDDYTSGDADVTQNSSTVTSNNTSTAWTPDMVGRAFKTDGYTEVYRIQSVNSVTSLTLVELFNGSTTADVAYTIAQDLYPLPADFDGELNFVQFTTPANLDLMDPIEFDQMRHGAWGGNILGTSDALVTDEPRRATIRGVGDDDRLMLQLDPFPDASIQVRFTYYSLLPKLVSDQDTWPFPSYMESIIHDGALSMIRTNAQDDERGQFDLQKFMNSRNEVAGLQRVMDVRARFEPDTGQRRRRRRARRISPGRYDLSTEFDRVY